MKFAEKLTVIGTLLLLVLLILIGSNGYLYLGGEGNYFTRYSNVGNNIGVYSWSANLIGTGFPNPTLNATVGMYDLFSLIQRVGVPYRVLNYLTTASMYLLPFLSIYWLFRKILKTSWKTAYLVSLVYILNPFCTYHIQGLMFWNISPLFTLPVFFGIIYSFFEKPLKLGLFFGLCTALLSFSFANIPYLGIFEIFLFLSIFIVDAIKFSVFKPLIVLRNFLILEISFVFFNAWWLLNLIYFYISKASNFYTKNFAVSWAKMASGEGDIVNKLFAMKPLLFKSSAAFINEFYFNKFIVIVLFIPLIILITSLFYYKIFPKVRRPSSIILGAILMTIFFNKGVNEPFLGIYTWALEHIPFFVIFKTPVEKFSVLLIFLICLYLAIILDTLRVKTHYYLLVVYLVFCSIPYLSLNFIPDFKIDDKVTISRRFINKPEYLAVQDLLNSDALDYRYLSLPGSGNYQVTMQNHDNKYYRGMDPILYGINKPFIAAYSGDSFLPIFQNIGNKNIGNLLSLYSVKKIMINEDIFPSFGFVEKESISTISANLSKTMTFWKEGSITLFDNPAYLSHLYISSKILKVEKQTASEIASLTLSDNFKVGSIFVSQNEDFISDILNATYSAKLSFNKISPDKYVVNINGLAGATVLVFNESYDADWIIKSQSSKVINPAHFKVNGFANAWVIDPAGLCKSNSNICQKTDDGNYQLFFSIEYWPRDLYLLGLIVFESSLTLLSACLIYSVLKVKYEK